MYDFRSVMQRSGKNMQYSLTKIINGHIITFNQTGKPLVRE